MPKKTKVLIVDDHWVVREGLCAILETKDDIQVVGEAKDGGEAVSRLDYFCQMSFSWMSVCRG